MIITSSQPEEYARFDAVLAAVKRAGVSRMGMVGNERFARSAG
jgi:hypothetical protein